MTTIRELIRDLEEIAFEYGSSAEQVGLFVRCGNRLEEVVCGPLSANYPECMFAMFSAFLPSEEGDLMRALAGNTVFKSTDNKGRTYMNGLLHSYDDKPAVITTFSPRSRGEKKNLTLIATFF